MKNAADLLHTIANNHGVALPADNTPPTTPTATHASAAKPNTTKRRSKAQDEDDNATPSDASEATSSTDSADSAPTEPQTSSQIPVQIADAGPASAGDAASTPGHASSSSSTYPSTRSSAKNGASTGDENGDSDSNPLWLPLTLLATGGVINYYHNTTHDHTTTTAPSPTGFTVSGTAVLGPVVAGHSLTVVAYRADGSVLQQATLNPDGSYTLTVTENYTGALLLRLVDANSGVDYRDEASGTARDLGADLRAATVIAAPGSYTVHINPLTELAVRQLGLAGGDNAGSAVSLAGVSASAIAQANSLVAAALGLSGTDIVSTSAIAAVLPDGSANPAVNALGLVLAAFSGMEDGRSLSIEQMLQDLSVRIADSSARSALVFDLIAGLANVDSVRDRIGAFAQSLGLSAMDAQAAASAWSAIFTLADGSASTAPRPSAQGYAAIGITGMQPAQASLLGDVIDLKGRGAINSVSEVQSLANIAAKVMRHAAGLPQAITQAELETLGITSLNPARLAALLDTLAASADDGGGADTLPELQAMVDAIAPGAPSFDFASPSGEPARPYVVNIETAAVPLTGTVAGGATTVTLQIGSLERLVSVNNGVWSYTLTDADLNALGQGTVSVVASARDAAGNTSEVSASADITIETVPPGRPTINRIADDNIINAAERDAPGGVVISGTCEDGASVSVQINGSTFAASVGNGVWSLALSKDEIDALSAAFSNGQVTFSVSQTDAAGNTGPAITDSFQIDTTVAAPTINAVAGDGTIDVAERNAPGGVVITGTKEAGAKVFLSLGLRSDGTYEKTIEIPASTDPNAATTWSYTLSAADYAFMGQGADRIRVVQQDAAGNTSAETTQEIIVGNTVVTAPNAPTIDGISSGAILNAAERDAGVTITGTKDAGASVSLRFSRTDPTTGQVSTVTVQLAASEQTTWSYVLSAAEINAMGQGPESFTATQTEVFGNTSTATQSFYIDVDPPEAPAIEQIVGAGTITTDPNQDLRILGIGQSGCTVVIKFKDQTRFVEVPVSLGWSYVLTPEDLQALGQGTVTFHISQSDAADNASEEFTADVFIDTVPPQGLSMQPLLLGDTSIVNLALRNSPNGATLSGTCEEGGTLEITISNDTLGSFNRTVTATNGRWSYTLTDADYFALTDPVNYVFTITQTDDFGNTSTATQSFYIDVDPPEAPNLDQIVGGGTITANPNQDLRILGIGQSGCTVVIKFKDQTRFVEVAPVSFEWSYVLTPEDLQALGQGTVKFHISQSDAADNASEEFTADVFIDTVPPQGLGIDATTSPSIINLAMRNDPSGGTISGVCEQGGTLRLVFATATGSEVFSVPVNVVGNTWGYTLTNQDYTALLLTSDYVLTIVQTDDVGNSSRAQQAYIIDTRAPLAPVVAAVSVDNAITSNEVGALLRGTGESGATVNINFAGVENRQVTVVNGNWSYALTQQDITSMGAGSETLTFVQTDRAGNASSAVTRVINVLPSALTINPIAGDDFINAAERDAQGGVTISGTKQDGLAATLTIGGLTINLDAAGSDWSYMLTSDDYQRLGQGTQALTLRQTDAAGNSRTATLDLSIDTVAPGEPTIAAIAGDNVINIAERDAQGGVTITGTREAGAKVFLSLGLKSDGTYEKTIEIPSSTDPNANATTWSYVLTAADYALMGEGSDTMSVVQQDTAGNTSAPAIQAIEIDFQGSTALTINQVAGDNVINAEERAAGVTISGSCGANPARLVLRIDGVDRAITPSNGEWTYTLVDDDYRNMSAVSQTLTITETDAQNNSNATSQPITVDTAATDKPTVGIVSGENVISIDDLADNKTVVITGTRTSDVTAIELSIGNLTRNATLTPSGWTYTLSAQDLALLNQGSFSVTAVAIDSVGNRSAVSDPQSVLLDTIAPDAPTINTIVDDNAINVIEDDNVINIAQRDAGVTITGTKDSGASVSLRFNGIDPVTGQAITVAVQLAASEQTTWSYVLSAGEINAMGQGSESFTATQTDAAGNVSEVSVALDATVDTVAPLAPTINTIATDNVINIAERDAQGGVTITGTKESGASGSLRFSWIDPVTGLTSSRSVRIAASDDTTWSYVLSAAEIDALDQGPVSVSATQLDAAGNRSEASRALVVTVDTIVPDAPRINTIATDNVINIDERDAQGGVTITGTREAGAKVFLSLGLKLDGTYEKTIEIPASTDSNANATTWSYVLTAADYALMGQGADRIRVVQQDAAGNTSAESTQDITVGNTVVTAPNAPTIDGISSGPIINAAERDASVTISGTKDAGASVSLRFSGINPATGQAITVTVQVPASDQTTWSYVLSAAEINAMGQGPESFTATQTDAAGNISAVSAPLNILVDTLASGLTIQTVAGNDVINLAERNATTGVVITGRKESGASIVLRMGLLSDGTYKRNVLLEATDGTSWSYTLSSQDYDSLGQGSVQVLVIQTDAAGNSSQVDRTITIDTLAPVLAIDPIAGIGDDSIINSAERAAGITITGIKEAGLAATLRIGTGITMELPAADGTWSYTLTDADYSRDGLGPKTVTLTQTDAAGNTSTAQLVIRVDFQSPGAPGFNTVGINDVINASQANSLLTGVDTIGSSSVVLTIGGVERIVTFTGPGISGSVNWEYRLTDQDIINMGQGEEILELRGVNPAGIRSSPATRTITVDTIAPDVAINPIAGIGDDNTINIAERAAGITITGRKDAGLAATLTIGTGFRLALPAAGDTWSYTFTDADYLLIGQGQKTIILTQTDAAGNTSTAPLVIALDFQAPTSPTFNAVAVDNAINASETNALISGLRGDGQSVVLTIGGFDRATTNSGSNWEYRLTAQDIANMGQGPETLQIRSFDAAGNSVSVSRDITVDTIVPVVAINPIAGIGDDNTINIAERAAGITISGIKDAGLAATLTIGTFFTLTLPAAGGTWSYTLTDADYSRIGQGSKTMTLTQTDAAGNSSSTAPLAITLDFVAPNPPGFNTVGINNVINASQANSLLTGIDSAGSSLVVLTIGGVERIVTFTGPGISGSVNWEYRLTDQDIINMGQGDKILELRGVNAAGNRSLPNTSTVTVDTIAPVVAINPIAGIGDDNTINIAERAAGITITGIKDAGRFATLTIGTGFTLALPAVGDTWSYTLTDADYSRIGQGQKAFTLIQTDAAGNTSTVNQEITLDFQAPSPPPAFNTVAGNDVISASETTTLITGFIGTPDSALLTIGGVERATERNGNTWSYRLTLEDIANMGQGTETLEIRAVDAAGNRSVPSTRNITVNTVAPAQSADAANAMAQLAAAAEPAAPSSVDTPSDSHTLAAIWQTYNGALGGQKGIDWQPPAQPLSVGVGTTGGHDAGVPSAWLDANPGSLLAHQVL